MWERPAVRDAIRTRTAWSELPREARRAAAVQRIGDLPARMLDRYSLLDTVMDQPGMTIRPDTLLLKCRGSVHINQVVEQDRGKVVTVDADVELTRHRLQPSMAVPMQVQGTAVLSIPASERVMA